MLQDDFRVGQTLTLSCEPTDARVESITKHYVSIEWPWREPDPESQIRWSGKISLPSRVDSAEWINTPWRTEPSVEDLRAGIVCMIGIPPTNVIVRDVRIFTPARDVGWLPRPTLGLGVVPEGESENDPEAGYLIYVDGGEPISVIRS
ncbi:hypothetical protein GCM10009635_49640 [Actinocatenispora thailandica]